MSVISSLLNKTFPFEDFKFPAIKLNKVVLPDPFGPIIPVIYPFLISIEQSDTAARPPKYLDKLLICKIFSLINNFSLIFYEYYLEFFLMIYNNQTFQVH